MLLIIFILTLTFTQGHTDLYHENIRKTRLFQKLKNQGWTGSCRPTWHDPFTFLGSAFSLSLLLSLSLPLHLCTPFPFLVIFLDFFRRSRHFQTQSLRGWELFNYDLQQWHWAKCFPHFVFYICLSLCRRQRMPKICTMFYLVNIKKRSFLTSCECWFISETVQAMPIKLYVKIVQTKGCICNLFLVRWP